MYKYVTPGLWLFLLSLFASYFPYWFIRRRYEKKPTKFPADRRFLLFYFLLMGWFFTSIILGFLLWVFFAKGNLSQVLAVLSVVYASIALPIPLFSAFTGAYPEFTRLNRYYYYEHYKSHLGQPPPSSDKRHLKIVSWLQVILLAVTIGVSSVYVVW